MSIKKTVTLKDVKLYYTYAGKEDNFGKFSTTVALTEAHKKQLLDAGLSEHTMNPKTKKVLDRIRSRKITQGENKEVVYEGLAISLSKSTPIRVEMDGAPFTGLVGNGSTCDILVGLNENSPGEALSPKPTGIIVRNLVKVEGSNNSDVESFFSGASTEEINRLQSI